MLDTFRQFGGPSSNWEIQYLNYLGWVIFNTGYLMTTRMRRIVTIVLSGVVVTVGFAFSAVAESELVETERQSRWTAISATLPDRLAAAVPPVPSAAAEALAGLHLTGVRDEGVFQEVAYSDGKGVLFVSWQRWPADVDPSMFVTEYATIERAGDLDVVVENVDLPRVQMRSVRVFDGAYLVTVSGHDIGGLDIGAVRRLAESVYQEFAGRP